jgi:hypothetical protein
VDFDRTAAGSVDAQLCQFLNSTRRSDLAAKAEGIRFDTKRGKRKRSLAREDWRKVGDSLGPTSVLSLLYRKRIKSNYRDIDTFLSQSINAPDLYRDLINVVATMNLVHEAFVSRALGHEFLSSVAGRLRRGGYAFLGRRLPTIVALEA